MLPVVGWIVSDMPANEAETAEPMPAVPSTLDLVRLSRHPQLPSAGQQLLRHIGSLARMSAGQEVLGVASGRGAALSYFVSEFGVTGSGVDYDADLVEQAEGWSREQGLADQLQFQTGRPDALPYREGIFDVSIGEIGLSNHCAPEEALRELVRVTKLGGVVVIIQLVLRSPVEATRQQALSENLGVRPMLVTAWEDLLRESGVGKIQRECWSNDDTLSETNLATPFPDFAELFSLKEKVRILRKASSVWGWRGLSTALVRAREIRKLLKDEQILGLAILTGRKGETVEIQSEESSVPEEVPAHLFDQAGEATQIETNDLPLFRSSDEASAGSTGREDES